MIYISFNGENLLVNSLDGYDGCTVIADNIDAPTDEAAVWDGTAFTVPLATLQARKRREVDLYLYQQFQGGFTPATGPVAGHALQTRDDTDRTNWLTSQAAYLAQINAGNGAALEASFRTADNLTITCAYSDGYSTLLAMAAWGKSIMGKSWTLKDQIASLTDPASVEAYDVATQWAALP